MRETAPLSGLPKHRIESLTDGIFAVAMTLLVIDLKIPESGSIHTGADVAAAVVKLTPAFISWIISFFVLAIFWFSNHRLFHFIRVVDSRLAWRSIYYLAIVSLLPFSSSLVGVFSGAFVSQCVYSANMSLLALTSFFMTRYVWRHPELWDKPLPAGYYRAARFRVLGSMTVALAAIGIARVAPGAGNAAFTLMFAISRYGRRLEVITERE
jgi:TMEM175 potassium channel family protein